MTVFNISNPGEHIELPVEEDSSSSELLRSIMNKKITDLLVLDTSCSLNLHICDSDDMMIEKLPALLKEIGPYRIACPTAKIRHKLSFQLNIPTENMFILQGKTNIEQNLPVDSQTTLIIWDYLHLTTEVKSILYSGWKRIDLVIKLLRMITESGEQNTELFSLVV